MNCPAASLLMVHIARSLCAYKYAYIYSPCLMLRGFIRADVRVELVNHLVQYAAYKNQKFIYDQRHVRPDLGGDI